MVLSSMIFDTNEQKQTSSLLLLMSSCLVSFLLCLPTPLVEDVPSLACAFFADLCRRLEAVKCPFSLDTEKYSQIHLFILTNAFKSFVGAQVLAILRLSECN